MTQKYAVVVDIGIYRATKRQYQIIMREIKASEEQWQRAWDSVVTSNKAMLRSYEIGIPEY